MLTVMDVLKSEIFGALTKHFSKRLVFLKAIVEQNSFTENPEGVDAVQDIIERELQHLGFVVTRTPCKDRGSMLCAEQPFVKATGAKPILLLGHADTVHAPSTEYASFEDREGILTGPGVFDMKSGLMEMLLVLDVLHDFGALNTLPLRILINSSEENSTPETLAALGALAKGAQAALVFEIGRPEGGIVLERKGIVELWCECAGKEAHSGNNFDSGINAILPLCRIAQKASSLVDEAEGVTVNIGQFSGGTSFCVVPGRARLGIEIRAGHRHKQEATLAAIQGFAVEEQGVTVRVDTFTGPLNKTPESEALFAAFAEAAKGVDLQVQALPRVGGFSDANIMSTVGVPAIDALGPTGGKAHTREEFVHKDSITPRAAAVAAYLLGYTDAAHL